MPNEQYNPYDFINPIKDPKLFAGRKAELKEIDYYLELSKSKSPKYTHLALIGERACMHLLDTVKSFELSRSSQELGFRILLI